MLVTNHAAHAAYARYLTTQAKDDELEYIHNEIGYNFRLSNLQAALGVAQLEQLDGFVAKKRDMAQRYASALRDVAGVTVMPVPPHVEPTYWMYTILLPEETTLAQRQWVVGRLHAAGIGARPLWSPMHRLPPHQMSQRLGGAQAEQLYVRSISLPSSVGLSAEDLKRTVSTLNAAVSP